MLFSLSVLLVLPLANKNDLVLPCSIQVRLPRGQNTLLHSEPQPATPGEPERAISTETGLLTTPERKMLALCEKTALPVPQVWNLYSHTVVASMHKRAACLF